MVTAYFLSKQLMMCVLRQMNRFFVYLCLYVYNVVIGSLADAGPILNQHWDNPISCAHAHDVCLRHLVDNQSVKINN